MNPRTRRHPLIDEHVVILGEHHTAGILGPRSSSFTLAWLASHRNRLWTLLLGGKRLSLLLVWDTKGGEECPPRTAAEVEAMAKIVYGSER